MPMHEQSKAGLYSLSGVCRTQQGIEYVKDFVDTEQVTNCEVERMRKGRRE